MPMPMPLPGPQMEGAAPSSAGAPAPDLSSLLGLGAAQPPSPQFNQSMNQSLRMFDQIEKMVQQMTQMFPGGEDAAMQILDALMRWKQQALVASQPPPTAMPGAAQMF